MMQVVQFPRPEREQELLEANTKLVIEKRELKKQLYSSQAHVFVLGVAIGVIGTVIVIGASGLLLRVLF
jgi:hypothetical protein